MNLDKSLAIVLVYRISLPTKLKTATFSMTYIDTETTSSWTLRPLSTTLNPYYRKRWWNGWRNSLRTLESRHSMARRWKRWKNETLSLKSTSKPSPQVSVQWYPGSTHFVLTTQRGISCSTVRIVVLSFNRTVHNQISWKNKRRYTKL